MVALFQEEYRRLITPEGRHFPSDSCVAREPSLVDSGGWQGWLLGLLACWFFSGVAFAQTEDVRQRFLTEAPRKWKEHRELCDQLPLQVEIKVWLALPGTANYGSVPQEHLQTKRNKSGTLLLSMTGSIDAPYSCWVLNERYAFELQRKKYSDPWFITRVDKDPVNSPIRDYLSWALHDNVRSYWSTSPFVFHRTSLESLVEQPRFEVVKAETVQKNGQTMVRVEFRAPIPPELVPGGITYHYEKGWVILDPDRFWVPCEYEANVRWLGAQDIKTVEHGILKCTEISKGLPVLEQMLVRTKGKGTKGPPIEFDLEYKTNYTIEVREPSPDEFTLTAFGFPEPLGLKRPTPWYIWAGVAGAVCLVLALGLRWLARCRATQRPTSS